MAAIDWGKIGKPELQRLCREAGLPTSGDKEALAARLSEHAARQAQPAPPVAPPVPDPPPEQQQPTPADLRQTPPDGYNPKTNTYRAFFTVPADSSDDVDQLNERMRAATYSKAAEQGLTPRGGLYAARLVAQGLDDGQRYYLYEVSVRKLPPT